MLTQIKQGIKKPIAFASRALTDQEKKYSVGEREALACLLACEGWHTYLYSCQFVLRTDHRALTVLLSSEGSGHQPLEIHRWFDHLNQYNFGVQYRPGKQNQVADFLSRASANLHNTECAVGGETFRVVRQ